MQSTADTLIPAEVADPTPTTSRDQGSWRDFAVCKGQLQLFFAKNAERPQARARREAKAKALCDSCPVAEPCRDYARDNREYGYWAGESEEVRHLLGYTVTAPIGLRSRAVRVQLGELDAQSA